MAQDSAITRVRRLVYILTICLGISYTMYRCLPYSSIPGSDFEQDYVAAVNLMNGLPIYQAANAHPPFNALFFAPFTLLSAQQAFLAFGLLSLALLCVNIAMIRAGLKLTTDDSLLLLSCFIFWPATTATVCLGQSSIIWAGAITAGWLCEKKGQPVLAGVFVGLATLLKLIPGLIIVSWYVGKRRRAANSATLVVLAGFLLMFALAGLHEVLYFFLVRIPENSLAYIDFYGNASITGTTEKLFGGNDGYSRSFAELPLLVSAIKVAVSAALVYWTMRLCRESSADSTPRIGDYRYALVIVAMLLLSPLTWHHYYEVLIYVLSLLFLDEWTNRLSLANKFLVLSSLLLLLLPISIQELSRQGLQFWVDKSAAVQAITISETIALCMFWGLLRGKIKTLQTTWGEQRA